MDIESVLSGKINLPDINRLAAWASCDVANRERLFALCRSGEGRTGVNALWVMTHLPASESGWLNSLQDELIGMLLSESVAARKRMLLQLLREQDFDAENIRADFLDYCLTKINSECEPYAVRCFCIYIAFKLCRSYPELIAELGQHLDMLSLQPLSPGLKCALRKTRADISRLIS